MIFPEFSDSARVWVYQANRPFSPEESKNVESLLGEFITDWSAHGKKLKAESHVLTPFHIALCVEGDVQASGCSIDASVRFIKQIGSQLNIDFFNRLNVLLEDGDKFEFVPFAKLKEYPDSEMFNPMINTLGELRHSWKIKVAEFSA